MWKKSMIALITFISVISIGFSAKGIMDTIKGFSPSFVLSKGSKIIIGQYNGTSHVWDVGKVNSDHYILMSTLGLGNFPIYDDSIKSQCVYHSSSKKYLYCPVTKLNEEINTISFSSLETPVIKRSVFIPTIEEAENGGTLGMTAQDQAFQDNGSFWIDGSVNIHAYTAGVYGYSLMGVQMIGQAANLPTTKSFYGNTNTQIPAGNRISYAMATNNGKANLLGLRPYLSIFNKDIVFAAAPKYTNGALHAYSMTTGTLGNKVTTDAMVLRIKNANLNGQLVDIKSLSGESKSQYTQNGTISLQITANSYQNSHISVLFYDASTHALKYYKMLETTKDGTNNYELDLTGVPIGKYELAILNEDTSSTSRPVYSSVISDTKPLEIIAPLKSVTVKPNTNLVYDQNVFDTDPVATITSSGGAQPISFTLLSDTSVAGHENDYQLFTITEGNQIVVNNPDGLAAGDYYFKVTGIDANGDPTGGVNSSVVRITVAKKALTIAFDDPSTTKKSMADATTAWSETATATPITGVKITYSKTGGFSSLIEIDSETGQVTYNGNNAFNKVTIRATADDDPATGNDNYDPVYVEKEIVIYRDLDAILTPDSASSDTTTPTFTASQANVKGNGLIGTVQGTEGTPDTIGGTQTTYRYEIINGQDSGMFQITTSSYKGTIKVKAGSELGVGSYHLTVRVSDNWSSKDVAVTVNVGVAGAENLQFYETSAAVNMITSKSVKVTDTNVTVFACVKGSTNTNPVKYKIKDGSTNVIEINENSGAVTIHGVGTVTIVAEKQGATGQADAYAELTFTVTAGTQNFIYTDNAGNELPKSGSNYSAKKEVYEPNKTFQLYTAGNPTGSTVSYQLKAGSPTDVISVDASGLVTILNASQNSQMGKVIVQATSHDPTGNYADKIIELPINIDKGTRVITFADDPIYVVNGSGSVAPVVEVDGVVDTSGDILIEVDSNEDGSIVWTNDNKTIEYDYTESSPKDIKIHATKPMDRNYKVAEADGTIHIMGPDENVLAITSPGKITYGDHFAIKSTQFDADSTNVQYTFEIDDTTYVSNPTVNGNIAEFDALKYSGSKKTTITVTRTADGESPLSKKVQVTILPKPIEITIDDKEKYKGEQNPVLTYQDFKNQLVTWNGVQDVIQANDIKLSTTAKTNSNAGGYPIKGDANTLNKTYPNYSFKFKEGTLTIKEDHIEDDWYHLEINDGNNTAYTGKWTNQDVNIISDHNEYINLSLDQSTWKPNQVTLSKEGETNQSFWMKKDSGAITKEKQEIIKIDKTPPKVKTIKAKDTNNKLQDIINKISGGIFFKPGTSFEVTTSDAKDDLKVSGTMEIGYKVYKLDTVARSGEELMKEGKLIVTKEKASITISETVGKYKVCVIPTDNAGNTNTESCHEVELKKIDVDVDGDGKPDFNDPDGDGCPDLNIKWKDPNDEGKWIVINGDRDYDGIPDLNIDSDGDGKADLNIDTDHDGKPDLNLVILKKSDWKPTKCVKQDIDNGILEEYCTGTSVKALINIDTDNDRIPNINIDNKGDFKPHINISKDGKNAIINITVIHDWKPELNKALNSFQFDTMAIDEKKDVLLNIDTDGDGRPDVNIDLDGDNKPDINVDTDFDWIPDIDIDNDGDGEPDINVDTDQDGKPDKNIVEITEWKPEKNIDGDTPYDTMEFPQPEEPQDPKPQDHSKDVQGYYHPSDDNTLKNSIGGALTGDETNIMLHLCYMGLGIGIMIYLCSRFHNHTIR